MDATVIKNVLDALIKPRAQATDLARQLGGVLKPMPPNQYELRAPDVVGLDMIEIVLSRDGDNGAPVRVATVILTPVARVTLGELEDGFGPATLEEDTGRPRPAQLVSFPRATGDGGLEIGITARIERPANKDAQVRSVQFTRSGERET